ncbi:MAG: hypothetical protein N2662_07340 [Bacteroidales bacterium]|nr:hypothetical protein [Bacteroidales bacterium]
MSNFRFFIFVLFVLFTIGCRFKPENEVDLSKVNVDLKIMRFEQDLFALDPSHIKDSLPIIRKRYGEFLDLFSYKVIRIGSPQNPSYPDYLVAFLTDYNINKVKKNTDSLFGDFGNVYGPKLEEMFRYFRFYFPNIPIPIVITYISGFNQSIVTTDTILGIALDKYLGGQNPFYGMLGLPRYLRIRMYPQYITADCAKAWAITHFPLNDSLDQSLLAHIIYEGKIIYAAKKLLPNESDSLIFGMMSSQLEWCKKFEAPMWEYLLDKKYLFSSDFQVIKRFVDEAPFTKDFGQNSPGRAVIWIGYRIVDQYVRNSGTSLLDLMNESDMNKILRTSKYKP